MFNLINLNDEYKNYARKLNIKNQKYFVVPLIVTCVLLMLVYGDIGTPPSLRVQFTYSELATWFSFLFLLNWCCIFLIEDNKTLVRIILWLDLILMFTFVVLLGFLDIMLNHSFLKVAVGFISISITFSTRLIFLPILLLIAGASLYISLSLVESANLPFYAPSIIAATGIGIVVFVTVELQRRKVFNAQRKLRKKINELNNALDVKSTFVGHMSHELRTPLNAIIGFSDMLLDEKLIPDNNPKVLEYAKYINSCGVHLLSLVTDLLEHNKIESGELKISFEQFNVTSMLQDCSEDLRSINMVKNQTFMLTSDNNKLEIYSDKRLFKQIIYNLLSNAQKYSNENSVINIKVVSTNPEQIDIYIKDEGKGMADNIIKQLISPNLTTNSHFIAHAEGTGLGLIIVHQFIARLNGNIEVNSVKNVGTEVKLSLPKIHKATH